MASITPTPGLVINQMLVINFACHFTPRHKITYFVAECPQLKKYKLSPPYHVKIAVYLLNSISEDNGKFEVGTKENSFIF